MSSPDTRAAPEQTGGGRVFADELGRQWSVAPHLVGTAARSRHEVALVFTCVSQARVRQRAATVLASERLGDVPDDTLRAWLNSAPRLGRLT